MDNLNKAIALSMAGIAVYTAYNHFSNQLSTVERQGANLVNVAWLVGLGAVLVMRFDNAAIQANRLLS